MTATRLNKIILVSLVFTLANLIYFSPFYFRGLLPFPGDLLVSFFFPWSGGGFPGFNPWTTHKEYLAADAIRQLLPWRALAYDLIKQGSPPLWNPYNFSGNYLLANVQSAIFFPGSLLFLVLPGIWAWVTNVLVLMTLFGFFTALFLRSLKLTWVAAVFGGLAATNIAYLVGWQEILVNVQSAVSLPLILLFTTKYQSTKNNLFLFLISLCIAISIFGGHLQTALYVFMATGAYMLFRRLSFKHIFICFVAGFVFASVQLLPSIEAYTQSAREAKGNDKLLVSRTFPWTNLASVFASDYFGNTATYTYQSFDYSDSRAYFGVVAAIFAVFGLMQLRENKNTQFFALFALGGLLLATSPGALLLVRSHIPILSSVTPARMIFMFDFGLVILCAYGFEHWLAQKNYRYFRSLFIIGFIYFGLWLIAGLKLTSFWSISLRNLVIPTLTFLLAAGVILLAKKLGRVAVAVLFVLAILEPAHYFIKYQPFSAKEFAFPSHPVLSYLHDKAGINRFFGFGTSYLDNNFATQYRIFAAEGYDPLYIKRYGELITSSKTGRLIDDVPRSDAKFTEQDNHYRNRLFDLLGVKFILDKNDMPKADWEPEYDKFPRDKYEMVWQESKWKIYERKSVLPRFFLANAFAIKDDDQAIVDKIYDKDFDLQKTLLLETTPALLPSPTASGTATLVSYTPNEVKFKISATDNQLLFLSDNYYPGWVARLNGQPTPIYRADYAFRAVAIPAGEHQLIFSYEPLSFTLGATLSVVSFLSFAGFVIIKQHG